MIYTTRGWRPQRRPVVTHLAPTLAAVLAVACTGETGPAGEAGPAGDPGGPGQNGPPGLACWDLDADAECDLPTEDINQDGRCDALDCSEQGEGGAPPTSPYVGSATCAVCHPEKGPVVGKSGHPFAMTQTAGGAPARPFDGATGGVPAPPAGYGWSDISYVVGGFGWKALYVDSEGYLVTGQAGESTQYNFANAQVGSAAGWVPYHPGEQLAYDCGSCHATGWIPCEPGETECAHQGDLAGMAGSFTEAGVQCEACHGPGAAHAAAPYYVRPVVDGSAAACGKCHRRDPVESIASFAAFVDHNQQYNEIFHSKKQALDCTACHDPHQSAKFVDPGVNPNRSLRIDCESCHVGYDSNQTSPLMVDVACVECHMPPLVKSAAGNGATRTGDVRSHLFGINTNAGAAQFSGNGLEAQPYLTLDRACNHCHGVLTDPLTPAELEARAKGYHGN